MSKGPPIACAPGTDDDAGASGKAAGGEIGARLGGGRRREVDGDARSRRRILSAKRREWRRSPRQDRVCASGAAFISPIRARPLRPASPYRGAGSSTSGDIASDRPQNSRRDRMRDTGSPAARRSAIGASRASAASLRLSSGARIRSRLLTPSAAHSSRRASAAPSSMPASARSARNACSAAPRVTPACSGCAIVRRASRGNVCTSCRTRKGRPRCGRPCPRWWDRWGCARRRARPAPARRGRSRSSRNRRG